MSPGPSRWKAWLALVATGVVLGGWMLPSGSASPPGKPARTLPSAIVSPPPTLPLRFSHAKHKDTECKHCHAKAETSIRSTDLLLPGKKVCLECHEEAKVPKGYGEPGRTNAKPCRKCHTRFNRKGFPAAISWKAPRYKFNHKLHRAEKQSCLSCHRGVDRASAGPSAGLHLPRMAHCLTCHNGSSRRAGSRCVTCHERAPGGRMRARYPEGKLIPGPSLPHLEHGPTFRRRHRAAAGAHRRHCQACHQRSQCLRCHGGVRKPASIHLGNYILRHGKEARANRQRCQACHTRQRFCLSCHSRTGFSATSRVSPFVSPGIKRFHGANWASSTTKGIARNRHAVHGRRNVGVCVSCHRERDCLRCHARRRIGGLGRSPHRPGFRFSRRCRVLLRKNRRSCIKCHGFNDPLMTLCR